MKIYHVSAFPKTSNGGNKAGVVLESDYLTEEEMQKIAKDVGYSETAFVMKSELADFKVRFFTPLNEVDLCGHATIATFNLLRTLDVIKPGMYTQETKAGILALDVLDDMVYMEQNKPIFDHEVDRSDIEVCFNKTHFIDENYPPIILSTGLREIFVPVKNRDLLDSLIPDIDALIELSIENQVIGVHLFALAEDCDAYGRNFAPYVGINEESATGTSNGALGCYLYKYVNKETAYTLRQGYSMALPSEIKCKLEIENDEIIKVWVGGTIEIL